MFCPYYGCIIPCNRESVKRRTRTYYTNSIYNRVINLEGSIVDNEDGSIVDSGSV